MRTGFIPAAEYRGFFSYSGYVPCLRGKKYNHFQCSWQDTVHGRGEVYSMRELEYKEIYRLEECLKELAEHHNEVSTGFKGCYPKRPFAETLESFREP